MYRATLEKKGSICKQSNEGGMKQKEHPSLKMTMPKTGNHYCFKFSNSDNRFASETHSGSKLSRVTANIILERNSKIAIKLLDFSLCITSSGNAATQKKKHWSRHYVTLSVHLLSKGMGLIWGRGGENFIESTVLL